MEREIVRLLPYILGGMFLIGVLLFLLALQQLRRRRTGTHWRMRRRAGDRGGRLFLISIGLMVTALVLALISVVVLLAHQNENTPNRGPDDLYGIVLSPNAAVTSQALTENVIDAATDTATVTPTAAPASATVAPRATSTGSAVFMTNTPGKLPSPTATHRRLQPDA